MRKIIAVLIVMLSCFQEPALAQTIFGGTDCGKWMADSNTARRAWVLGYMSGLSTMHYFNQNKDDPLDDIRSAEQIFLWMNNYCQKNPLSRVPEGGTSLLLELIRNRRGQN